MEEILLCLSDLVTGSSIPALSSLSRTGSAWLGLGGAALGVALSFAESRRPPAQPGYAQLARALLRVVLSSAQIFSLWDAKDGDVGAGLLVIPLFLVACAPTNKLLPDYLRRVRWLSSALNAVCLVAAAIYYTVGGGEPGAAQESWLDGLVALRAFLAVSDVAFASVNQGWPSQRRVVDAAARGLVLVLLGAAPSICTGLLRGPAPDWLFVVYTAALVQSVHAHACSARLCLKNCLPGPVTSSQRPLILLVISALAVGFVERKGDPATASLAVLAVTVLGVIEIIWAGKPGQYAL